MVMEASRSATGLRPKLIANLCHPGHTKILQQAATLQLNERSFIVGFGIDFSLFIGSIKKAIWAQAAKDELEETGQALEEAVHMVAERTAVQPEGKQDAATQAQQRLPSDENRRAAQQPTPALRTSTPAQRTNGGLLGTSQPHPNVTDRGAKKPRRLQPIVAADGVVHWRPGGRGDIATPITPGRRRVENDISDPEKQRGFVTFCAFLSYGAT